MGGTGGLMQAAFIPRSKNRLVRAPLPRHQAALPADLAALPLGFRGARRLAEYSSLDLRTTIARLRDAGLDSIPGGGAEILDDEVRHRIARLKCDTTTGSVCTVPRISSECAPPPP